MKLQFKSQHYQTKATQAVIDIFRGQAKGERVDIVDRKVLDQGLLGLETIEKKRFSNKELESHIDILANTRAVQKQDELLKLSTSLKDGLNFSIEMETGTGKTYVYTKTMFELHKTYGWSKFIIIVPSIAIREGVYKSLQITAEHFKHEYKKKLRYFIYDTKNSSNLTNIDRFANSGEIEVIVMNYQAFATSSNESRKIYEKQDSMQSRRPIDILSGTRPILLIDEPQRLGSTAEKKLKEFNPLFCLRYSATHKKDFHKIYRLDAIDAFNEKLVKKISVKAIDIQSDSATGGYIFFDSIKISKDKYPEALIEIDIKQKESIKKKVIKVSQGDNLFALSNNLSQYKDNFTVSSIDARDNSIKFLNGITLEAGQISGSVQEKHLRRVQIRETIKSHIQKEKELYHKGIKVLSLFFIDEVAKYRVYDEQNNQIKGEYEQIFEQEYKNVISEDVGLFDSEYKRYLDSLDIEHIHKGYFSIDKKGKLIDPKADKSGNSNDASAYDLIMKQKEKLLDFKEPTRFIFSHSALREGWDNPNVFQICTLKHSNSSDNKRQEIGRGLRICVDKDGIRQDKTILENQFFDINTLTVIASESYDSFASSLQKDILDSLSRETKIDIKTLAQITLVNEKGQKLKLDKKLATILIDDWGQKGYIGEDGYITKKATKDIKDGSFEVPNEFEEYQKELKELVKKASTKAVVDSMIGNGKGVDEFTLEPNKNFEKKEFQELWSRINKKATYTIDVDTVELVKQSVMSIDQTLEVDKVVVRVIGATQKEQMIRDDLANANSVMEDENINISKSSYELGDTKYDLIGEIEKHTSLLRKTIIEILQKISQKKFEMFKINPEDFIVKVSKLINQQKAKLLISGIKYHKTDEKYDTDIFTIPNFKCNLKTDTIEVKKHIYDYLKSDSNIEKDLAIAMDKGQIVVYAKLPNEFKIPMPMLKDGYNPDWAVVFENEDKKDIYFIAETKGDCDNTQLKGDEQLKIEYAKKYFECLNDEDVSYDCVANYDELLQKIFR